MLIFIFERNSFLNGDPWGKMDLSEGEKKKIACRERKWKKEKRKKIMGGYFFENTINKNKIKNMIDNSLIDV